MIDTDISDLFFDSQSAAATRNDETGEHSQDLLVEAAQEFIDHLDRLGVDTPEAEELADDYLNRL